MERVARMRRIIVILLILVLVGEVCAIKHVPRLHEDIQKNMDFLSKIRYFIIKNLRAFTIVNGYTCSDYPDDIVDCRWSYTSLCKVQCPTTVRGGCAVDLYDENYNFITEQILQPGEHIYICSQCSGAQIAENYYCNQPSWECHCSSWTSYGCGSGPCRSTEIYMTRTCNPPGCLDEHLCVESSTCGATTTIPTTTTITTTTPTSTTIPSPPSHDWLLIAFFITILIVIYTIFKNLKK